DRVRKEYETLKCTKEQEIQALQKKEQKLETENNRLRAELQALNKQCQKLRLERDSAVESSQETTERAIALEQDREKIQRQFKIFRETKESEIQALLQAKRQLESKLHTIEAHGVATMDDHNYNSSSLHNTSMTSGGWCVIVCGVVQGDTNSLIGCNITQSNYAASVHDMNEMSHDQPVVGLCGFVWGLCVFRLVGKIALDFRDLLVFTARLCYISATPDQVEVVKNLISHPSIQKLSCRCLKEGYNLSLVQFTDVERKSQVLQFAVAQSSLFIAFLGASLGRLASNPTSTCPYYKAEHNCKITLINVHKHTVSNPTCAHLRHQVLQSSNSRVARYTSPNKACEIAVAEISKAVRLEFGVKIGDQDTSDTFGAPGVTCIDDLMVDDHVEIIQQELANVNTVDGCVKQVGLEKYYERLDEVVTSPGPVPPLLVSGTSGAGKTLLLSSWVNRLQTSHPELLVLQHFVTAKPPNNPSPPRRLLSQLLLHLPLPAHPPTQTYTTYDVVRLREIFPRWLEQLSTRRNTRIILAIDSLDLLQDAEHHFRWILDPLPRVRVIISVGVDSCPDDWRQLPTLHLEPLTIQSVRSLLKAHLVKRGLEIPQNWEREVISHCRTATTFHPLYVTLLSIIMCSLSKGHITDHVVNNCLRTRDSVELYRIVVREVELHCSGKLRTHMKYILQSIICSKDGLSECEIKLLIPDLTWYNWTYLLNDLTSFCLIKLQGGLYVPHNSEVRPNPTLQYLTPPTPQIASRCRKKMLTWALRYHDDVGSPRSSDLLLWLLRREEERQVMTKILSSPSVFHMFYSRGHASELVSMWNYLNEEKSSISSKYRKEIKKMESSNSVSMEEVASMYESLGRFLKDLGIMDEAVSMLQRSLEIQETILDPDHPSVSNTLHHLAAVYTQWGKYSTAEPLFRQALEIVESAVGRDHLRVAQELSALIFVARKTGHTEVAEVLQQRKSNMKISQKQLERLRKRALRLEELTLGEDSIEMSQVLNDLGVLYHLQNNLGNAESFFQRSLKMREKLLGHNHPDVAQSLHNLASTLSEKKNFSEAVTSMKMALKIRRQHLNNHDPLLINSLKYMAMLHKKASDYTNACEDYKELLSIAEETTGADSVTTAAALVNLAVAECQNKQLDAALPLYQQALAIYRGNLGPNSTEARQTLRNIAVLLYQKGELSEAALVYKQSM
uniref:Nephrocystin-3 n=1 Tax=Ciona savignyi TaxID=51511 RepID=H2YTG2_CIOSA